VSAPGIQTVILCGGLGTRLREETEVRPKPMVEVGGRPILWHIMKTYAVYGFTDFVICLGYKGDRIKEYFLNYEAMNNDFTVELGRRESITIHHGHQENGWKVTLADTGYNTMTGGRIKRAAPYLTGDRFMLTYGDGLSNVNLSDLLAFHRAQGTLATVTGVHPASRFGELLVSGERVRQFSEKPQTHDGIINGGYFVFERGAMDYLSDDPACTLEKEPLERLAADGQLSVYRHDGFWQCMDTYRDYQLLNQLWESGGAAWKQW
jgi:glucose-1-phosphate cytidylyltransferase